MHVCRFPHNDSSLDPVLRSQLEETLYRFFVAEETDGPAAAPGTAKGAAGAAPGTGPATGTAPAPGTAVPGELARVVSHIAEGCRYRAHTAGVPVLAERVAHEAVAWCDEKWGEIADEDPFAREEGELARFREGRKTGARELASLVRALWARYPEAAGTWTTYEGAAEALSTSDALTRTASGVRSRVRREALVERVSATWVRLLAQRRRRFVREFLEAALPPFIEKLNREVPLMARAHERVADFFGESPRSWDLFEGDWQSINWQGLEEAARALDGEPTLARLAQLLGRSDHVPAELIQEHYEVVSEATYVETEALGRSEIEGVSLGADVENVIPGERALLADADTELVFSKRFADSELLSFDYRSAREVEHTDRQVGLRTRTRELERGPIISCVDTSGSMTGKPEQVAKAVTLALARVAAAGGRPVYLISFSTGIRTFDLAEATALPELTEFLSFSFHGGTDLRPALEETLRTLETEQYRRADVLVISDFRVPKLLDGHTSRMSAVQNELGALFHSLTVAPGPPVDPMHIFDFHWHYDTSKRDAGIVELAEL